MKAYKPISDREVARRLGVRSIHTTYYYLQIIQEIYDAGLIICERVSTDRPQEKWIPEIDEDELIGFYCSNCEYAYPEDFPTIMGEPMWAYCPNCGCAMTKESE